MAKFEVSHLVVSEYDKEKGPRVVIQHPNPVPSIDPM